MSGKHSAPRHTAPPAREPSRSAPTVREAPAEPGPRPAPNAPPASAEPRKKKKFPVWAGILLALVLILILTVGAGALFVNAKMNKLSFAKNLPAAMTPAEVAAADEARRASGEDGEEEDESILVLPEDIEIRQAPAPIPQSAIKKDNHIINVLFLGSDYPYDISDPGRADSVMLCSLNKKTGNISLVSFERAIGVSIPDRPDDWLTHSFHYGGAELTTNLIRNYFRLDLEGYVNVNFYDFINVIDAVGGVDLPLTDAECAHVGVGYNYGEPVHLDGQHALNYCRLRSIDSDFARTHRQRNTITAVIGKVRDMSLSEISDLLDTILPLVKTDLSKGQLAEMLLAAPEFLHAEVQQMLVPDTDELWCYMSSDGRPLYGVDFEEYSRRIQDFID